jgi:hypothetical protein
MFSSVSCALFLLYMMNIHIDFCVQCTLFTCGTCWMSACSCTVHTYIPLSCTCAPCMSWVAKSVHHQRQRLLRVLITHLWLSLSLLYFLFNALDCHSASYGWMMVLVEVCSVDAVWTDWQRSISVFICVWQRLSVANYWLLRWLQGNHLYYLLEGRPLQLQHTLVPWVLLLCC